MTISETVQLSFILSGEALTRILHQFLLEGSWDKAYRILEDMGLNESQIRDLFDLKIRFEGSSETQDLHLVKFEFPKKLDEFLFTGYQTALSFFKENLDEEAREDLPNSLTLSDIPDEYRWTTLVQFAKKNPESNFGYLFRVYSPEEFLEKIKIRLIRSFYPQQDFGAGSFSGVIFPSGELIVCPYEGHRQLFSDLRFLGIFPEKHEDGSEMSTYEEDSSVIKVSSLRIGGNSTLVGGEVEPTEAQRSTLFQLAQRYSLKEYGYKGKPICHSLLNEICEQEGHGGKWNNLRYIQKYHPEIRTPQISKEYFEGACIRTSPEKSLPGLLNSKFEIESLDQANRAILEIKKDWEKYKNIRKFNELHWFFQEYLEGPNGVCHIRSPDKGETFEWEFACSEIQGSIVEGKKSSFLLNPKLESKLFETAKTLWRNFETKLQLEFVVHENEVIILQMRFLEDKEEESILFPKPKNWHNWGKSFYPGVFEFIELKDVLIVEKDTSSEMLLGKKALIVMEDVPFAHILALSAMLKIPSMYGMKKSHEEFDFPLGFSFYSGEGKGVISA